MAEWSTSFINDLPDSSFLYIAPGGSKDADGKTTPRSLRYFPVKDASGKVDVAHLRNALARIPQSNVPASVKATATSKAQKMLSAAGGSPSGMKSQPPRDDLYRSTVGPELRDDDADGMATLTGHFAVFNEWTEVDSMFEGRFLERIAPGAFTKTLREGRDKIRVLFQHGKDNTIGDKPLGPITRLEEDERGVAYEVPLLDTDYNRELLPGLRAGLYGASFRFKVIDDDVDDKAKRSDYNPDGLAERTIKQVAVREFGPVTFPAYDGATATVRSLTDEFLFERMVRDPERLRQLLEFLPARMDSEDLGCLAQMIQLGACYIDEQDEPGDEVNIPKMEAILASLTELIPYEVGEDEGTEPEDDAMASDDGRDEPVAAGFGHRDGITAPPTATAGFSHCGAAGRTPLYPHHSKRRSPTWLLP